MSKSSTKLSLKKDVFKREFTKKGRVKVKTLVRERFLVFLLLGWRWNNPSREVIKVKAWRLRPRPQSINKISEVLGCSRKQVYRVMKEFLKLGLIQKAQRKHGVGRPLTVLTLTKKGRKKANNLFIQYMKLILKVRRELILQEKRRLPVSKEEAEKILACYGFPLNYTVVEIIQKQVRCPKMLKEAKSWGEWAYSSMYYKSCYSCPYWHSTISNHVICCFPSGNSS